MALQYKIIRIYTGEEVHLHGKPLFIAIIEYVRGLKIAARAIVNRGIAGCYENGAIATQSILDLSYNLPVTIEILLPVNDMDRVLPQLEAMVSDGIIAISGAEIYSYHSAKQLIPAGLKVREVMSSPVKTVHPATPATEIIQVMLENDLKGIPVTDDGQRPVGIITQGDLIAKVRLPVRLGLVKQIPPEDFAVFLQGIAGKSAAEIMSRPPVTVKEDQPLREAVQIMIKHQLKRLPVSGAEGKLVGMLARIDVLHTITRHAPHWEALQQQQIVINNNQPVKNVLQRDLLTVTPDTPIPEVIEKITGHEVQRIAVVDRQGKFLGLIADADLLPLVASQPGIWDVFLSKLTFTEKGRKLKELMQHARASVAGEIMAQNIIVIREDASIEEAVKLMAEKGIKRLPVIDQNGVFKGLISRDSVLQTILK